jgi:hypothetical protein
VRNPLSRLERSDRRESSSTSLSAGDPCRCAPRQIPRRAFHARRGIKGHPAVAVAAKTEGRRARCVKGQAPVPHIDYGLFILIKSLSYKFMSFSP